jgi:hypothetical protein
MAACLSSRSIKPAAIGAAVLLATGMWNIRPVHADVAHDFSQVTLASYLAFRFSSAVPPAEVERFLSGLGFSATDLSLVTTANSSVGSLAPDKSSGGVSNAQQISKDTLACPSTDPSCELDTQIEPDIANNPSNSSNLVAAFQQGRYPNGGSVDPGWAASFDGGRTWPVTGNAPGLTVGVTNTTNTGTGLPFARASDPVVAFDVDHKNVYFHTIAVSDQGCLEFCDSAIEVNISNNGGKTFSNPVIIEEDVSNPNSGPQFFNDKNWITVDNNPASRHFGRTYSVWDQIFCSDPSCVNETQDVVLRHSDDGGKTWSARITAEAEAPNNANVHAAIGVQPMVLSNGDVVVVYDDVQAGLFSFAGTMKAITSTDGGNTWSAPVIVTPLAPFFEESAGLRAPNLPSATTDGKNIWVAYQDSSLSGGTSNDILITSSSNAGASWSLPFNATPGEATLDHFTPGLASANGNLYLSYRTHPTGSTAQTVPFADIVFRKIAGGSASGAPVSLDATLTNLNEAAFTTLAGMQLKFLGDYAATAASPNTINPVWCQAQNFPDATSNQTNTHQRAFSAGVTP